MHFQTTILLAKKFQKLNDLFIIGPHFPVQYFISLKVNKI
ncbi:hypothetical protein ADICYQ_4234 [Cyclobacterium qasimii M12-11B]|uniref:Uncharacterized protein n=1 Tax=Cyclobacterium qasimii M12-11B TaxID=641524 RepID=S7VB79_9BACT|nr:hypothetical protein ADICYQ_4234 [Cyclobacterium qasimii M12-11B]